MWLYRGKAESSKVRHSKCVDCFAIKFRQFEDGLRQTQGAQKIAPNRECGSEGGQAELSPHRATRYPRFEEHILLMPVQVLPLSFGEDPNINLFADLDSHFF
jgi:hypothetical protein